MQQRGESRSACCWHACAFSAHVQSLRNARAVRSRAQSRCASRCRCDQVAHRATWPDGPQTARRLRPLARRALITLRPPAVFMRTRKPWVRLRRVTEGWYVRFMLLSLAVKPMLWPYTLLYISLVRRYLQCAASRFTRFTSRGALLNTAPCRSHAHVSKQATAAFKVLGFAEPAI